MTVGVGQTSFEDVNKQVPRERQLQDRVTFAEVATAEYWGIDPANYFDIDERMVQAAAPDRLQPFLIDVKRAESKMTAGYMPEGHNKERYVPLYPYEFSLVSGTHSPQKYGERAVSAALKGKAILLPSADDKEKRAQEKGIEAIEKKHNVMKGYLESQLQVEHTKLGRLLEAAEHPGLLRRKDVDTIITVAEVRNYILPQVLEVIGRNKQPQPWTEQQRDLASRAIDFRLFFARDHNKHLTNWRDMLKLLRDYDQTKIDLFEDRVGAYAGYLAKHGRLSE